MAKIVKTKKKRKLKKFNLGKFTILFLFFSGLSFFTSSLFLRSYNNNLSSNVQKIQDEITTLTSQNKTMEVENSTLATRDRVDQIISDSGMSVNQDNVITISETDGE